MCNVRICWNKMFLCSHLNVALRRSFQDASPNQFSLCSYPNVVEALERRFPTLFRVPHFKQLLTARLELIATCNEGKYVA